MPRTRRADRQCEFRIVDGVLYRTVELANGRSYRHTCTLESFADVAREYVSYLEEATNTVCNAVRMWQRRFY